MLQGKAAKAEAEAGTLRSCGEAEQARSLLTQFMRENLDTILLKLHELLGEFGN